MTFKAQLEDDMRVYLNADEFADLVMLQGRPVLAVLSKDSELALAEWRKRQQEPPGVGVQLLTLSVVKKDVEKLYATDEITLDDDKWTVLSSAEDAGLVTIHLYRHES
jgi:hypothetical protein